MQSARRFARPASSVSDRTILRQAIFLAGPTSVGKSDLALALAGKHRGEIVCADAFQLYREFPVLSAQPSAREQSLVPHHLFGTVACSEEMDAARFAIRALEAVGDIVARNKTPFVVGGSGLYLDALIRGLPRLPSIDPAIRKEVRAMTLKDMLARLRSLDPASLAVIDVHNPRRVARRLEISRQTGRPASEILTEPPVPQGLRGVVLTRDRDDLNARIAASVEARLAAGAIDEVRTARDLAGGTARQILGWREITALLDGTIDRAACAALLTNATRQYARRQLTWFRSKSTLPTEDLTDVTSDHLDRIARRLGLS
ncbi:MAG: tRNA (adenosine(37)-N6)-dimethylallyltransferase MiaA [Chthoniobacterales bacterium]